MTTAGSEHTEDNPLEVIGGFFKGVAEVAVETVADVASFGYRTLAVPYVDPKTYAEHLEGTRETLAFIAQDPGAVPSAMWSGVTTPIADDWQSGRPGEAAGRGTAEVVSTVISCMKAVSRASDHIL